MFNPQFCLMENFKQYLLTQGVGYSTASKYQKFVRQLLSEYGEIAADFQDKFVLDKLEKWSKNSIATYLKAVRHWARYKNIKLFKCSFKNLRQPSITPTFTEDEIAELTGHLLVQDPSHWSAFWLLVIWTGCRCGEIASLTQKQVNAAGHTIIINATKTKNVRNVPIPPHIQDHIYEYIDSCDDKLFPKAYCKSWNRSFRRLLERAGIKRGGLVPHSFRHTFITMLLDEDVALPKVMGLVGHKRIETTFRYTHLLSKSIQAAIRRHPVTKRFKQPEEKIHDLTKELMDWCDGDDDLDFDITHLDNGVSLKIFVRGSPKKGCPTDQAAKPIPNETPLNA